MTLLLFKFPGRSRMEDIQPVTDDMEFRRPEKIAQMGIHGGIQYFDFLGRNQTGNGIRLTDVKGMIVVKIIGCNKIILSFPFPIQGSARCHATGNS